MKFDEKIELLEHAKELARNLEEVTDKFLKVQLGWIEDLPITIMLNHKSAYFGCHENLGWNEIVVFNNINNFEPVRNPYLELNKLITQAYANKEK